MREIAATGDPTVLIDVDDCRGRAPCARDRGRASRSVELEGTELRITLADGLDPAERQPQARAGGHRRLAARACARDARGEVPRRHVAAGGQRMRLISAEVLKLVRRRGPMIWSLLLTVGAVVSRRSSSSRSTPRTRTTTGRRADARTSRTYTFLLAGLGNVAAILIGADRRHAGRRRTASSATSSSPAGRARRSSRSGSRARCSSSCRCSPIGFVLAIGVTYGFAGDKPHAVGLVCLALDRLRRRDHRRRHRSSRSASPRSRAHASSSAC